MEKEKDIKKRLSKEQYHILREKGTETSGSGKWLKNKATGTYICANCGNELFSSDTKFESGSGWPSFYDVMNSKNVKLHDDFSHGMYRTEVICAKCGSHLGHLFRDAPQTPTGNRYCINSLSLDFKKAKPKAKKRSTTKKKA